MRAVAKATSTNGSSKPRITVRGAGLLARGLHNREIKPEPEEQDEAGEAARVSREVRALVRYHRENPAKAAVFDCRRGHGLD